MTEREWVLDLVAVLDHFYPPDRAEEGCGAVQVGPLAPESGPDWCHVACPDCGATWTGHVGDQCSWCADEQAWAQPAVRDRPEVPGWVVCPKHDHTWQGEPRTVCGAHGGPVSCNEWSVWLTKQKANEMLRRAA